MSDVHAGTGAFKPRLMEAAVEETNAYAPDLVAVVGDRGTSASSSSGETSAGVLPDLASNVEPASHRTHRPERHSRPRA